jgi:hypothetical protein
MPALVDPNNKKSAIHDRSCFTGLPSLRRTGGLRWWLLAHRICRAREHRNAVFEHRRTAD